MKAMVLAAGFGSRLQPLTRVLPKSMFPVLGRPLLSHTLDLLQSANISEIAINVHHLPNSIIHYFKRITLDGTKILKIGKDINSIKDMVRINIVNFTKLLDDPIYSKSLIDNKGDLFDLSLPKAYYLDIIFRFSQQNSRGKMEKISLECVRIILDKKGIIRIE